MKNKVLVIYQFATFGGVERVLLNRAEAFKYFKSKYKLYVYFYEDYGAKKGLKKYIEDKKLNDYIEIVNKFNPKDYDYIVSIDTPQLFSNKKINLNEVIVETHTIEKQFRKYLNDYINKVAKVVVPSKGFYNVILNDYKNNIDPKKVKVINNFVTGNLKKSNNEYIELPLWNKNIIFYYGRLDYNKNTKELIRALKSYNNKYNNTLLLLLVGKSDPGYELSAYITEQEVKSQVVVLPPINFDKIEVLLNTMKKNKAIFVSSSKGETFSLSAAESISHEIPVILSDIDAHKTLVENNSKFLYKLSEETELVEKIHDMIESYDDRTKQLKKYKDMFSANNFIQEWEIVFPSKIKE